jgi:hypothetical protein
MARDLSRRCAAEVEAESPLRLRVDRRRRSSRRRREHGRSRSVARPSGRPLAVEPADAPASGLCCEPRVGPGCCGRREWFRLFDQATGEQKPIGLDRPRVQSFQLLLVKLHHRRFRDLEANPLCDLGAYCFVQAETPVAPENVRLCDPPRTIGRRHVTRSATSHTNGALIDCETNR